MISPAPVRFFPAIRSSFARTASGSDGECAASNRSCTALATLLTFCPPGPEERMKLSPISFSSMDRSCVMEIRAMGVFSHDFVCGQTEKLEPQTTRYPVSELGFGR